MAQLKKREKWENDVVGWQCGINTILLAGENPVRRAGMGVLQQGKWVNRGTGGRARQDGKMRAGFRALA